MHSSLPDFNTDNFLRLLVDQKLVTLQYGTFVYHCNVSSAFFWPLYFMLCNIYY